MVCSEAFLVLLAFKDLTGIMTEMTSRLALIKNQAQEKKATMVHVELVEVKIGNLIGWALFLMEGRRVIAAQVLTTKDFSVFTISMVFLKKALSMKERTIATRQERIFMVTFS